MEKTLQDAQDYLEDMARELNDLASMDQMEMYRMLTEEGKALPPLLEDEAREENFVQGCVSNVYIAHSLEAGRIFYRGSSESHVVRGYVAILVAALSGLGVDDVVHGSRPLVQNFAQETNIRATLTPSRANAFGNIYELMVKKALGT